MSPFTRRITLRFSALVTATTILVLTGGGWLLQREMLRSMEQMHAVEYGEVLHILQKNPTARGEPLATLIETQLGGDAALYYIQIHDERGTILYRSDNLQGTLLPDLSGEKEPHRERLDIPEIGQLHMSEFRSENWHVQIASPLKPLWRILKNFARVSGLLVFGTAVLSLVLGYAFSRVILRPVRAIEQTARRIGADNLRDRVPVPAGNDELSSLAELLNRMFDRLETSFEQIRRFTADASHELKTPLALIRLNAEKLRPRLAADADSSASLDDLIEEISRMSQVIESMLFLSRVQGGVLAIEMKPQSIAALITPFAEDARVLAEDTGVNFVLAKNDSGEARVEPNLLRQLLLNLVGNAFGVSPRGGVVTLESEKTADGWRFVITDEGPGLPPEQLEKVFERFVRYDHGSGQNRGRGHGLGLAICRGIAELHGGSIHAQNRVDGSGKTGLRVVLQLPA